MDNLNSSTSNSKFSLGKEIIKLIVAAIVVMILFWKFITPQYSPYYNASIIEKLNRLENTDEPKIVLVGDSNLAFGIRSYLIEEATGMKVVNLGINAGLGNAFHEEMAKSNVNAGDIYILCHSCYYNETANKLDVPLTWITIENHFKTWRCVPKDKWYDMLLGYPTYAKKCTGLFLSKSGNAITGAPQYSRYEFNEYGDNIYSQTHEQHLTLSDDYNTITTEIDDEAADRINQLNKYITSRGGVLLLASYPIAYKEQDADIIREKCHTLENNLRDKLDVPVISNFENYMYTEDYFYDFTPHLTDAGAIFRTYQLIEDLNNYLK